MELNVIIERINDVQEFASKRDGSIIKKYSFVGKTNERFPKLICFTCFNEELWHNAGLAANMQVQVSFDISSKEWQGRWFTEAVVWKITQVGNYQKEQNTTTSQPTTTNQTQQAKDDVPF